MKKLILAVGGNALLRKGDKGTSEEQQMRARETAENIYFIFNRYDVVITHGNGPQVGAILLQNEHAKDIVPPMPLDVCGAMSQGEIAYFLTQAFTEVFREKGVDKQICAIVTRMVVDENDPAFKNPTKPVGPFYTEEEAKILMKEKGWVMIEDAGRGWRRVVPSPMPLEVVEKNSIRFLVEHGFVVIAVGGGGIPVVRKGNGYKGVEAVIDKDLASATLGRDIEAEYLYILTSVPKVYLNFGTERQKGIEEMSADEARKYLEEGHFKKGSMYPKILAAIKFLEWGGEEVLITSPEEVELALKGEEGTRIYPRR